MGGVKLNFGSQSPSHDKKQKKCPDGGRLLCTLYCIVIIVLGTAFPVREALRQSWLTTYPEAIFLAYVYGVSFLFILFIEIYLIRMSRKYGNEIKEDNKPAPQIVVRDNSTLKENTYQADHGKFASVRNNQGRRDTVIQPALGVEIFILEPNAEAEQHFQHETSLYVRFGAVIFGVGNMVYDGLLLKQMQTDHICVKSPFIWPHYLHLVFLLAQTYFIFKHPQVQISFTKPIGRFGFMHIFATNVIIWVRIVIRETLDSFLHHSHKVTDDAHDSHATGDSSHEVDTSSHQLTNGSDHDVYNSSYLVTNDSNYVLPIVDDCAYQDDILVKAAPYLFPCVLEYSLLAAAVMYSFYSDVGKLSRTQTNNQKTEEEVEAEDDMMQITEISFHKSHKGMFAGVMTIAAALVSIVLFFSYMEESNSITDVIYHATMIALYSLILMATMVGIVQLQQLKYERNKERSVDDILLIVSMTGLIMFQLFKLLPLVDDMSNGHNETKYVLTLVESILALVVISLQTWFIIDGLRRSTTTERQYEDKPARGAVIFLLLTNVALWLFRTFHMKEVENGSHLQESEYGYLAWQLMFHAFVPLLIFYHFHCSACLAQIWSGAYHPAMPNKDDTNKNSQETSFDTDSMSSEGSSDNNSQSSITLNNSPPPYLRNNSPPPFRRNHSPPPFPVHNSPTPILRRNSAPVTEEDMVDSTPACEPNGLSPASSEESVVEKVNPQPEEKRHRKVSWNDGYVTDGKKGVTEYNC